jgi:hypothetical protein
MSPLHSWFASIHAREASQAATVRANRSNEQLADRNLQEQFAKAKAAVRAAREVAANTPVEVKAAHTAFDQAKARYQAGLSTGGTLSGSGRDGRFRCAFERVARSSSIGRLTRRHPAVCTNCEQVSSR